MNELVKGRLEEGRREKGGELCCTHTHFFELICQCLEKAGYPTAYTNPTTLHRQCDKALVYGGMPRAVFLPRETRQVSLGLFLFLFFRLGDVKGWSTQRHI